MSRSPNLDEQEGNFESQYDLEHSHEQSFVREEEAFYKQ